MALYPEAGTILWKERSCTLGRRITPSAQYEGMSVPHIHDYLELSLIPEGRIDVTVNDHTLSADGPVVCIFQPFTPHAVSNFRGETYTRYLFILGDRVREELPRCLLRRFEERESLVFSPGNETGGALQRLCETIGTAGESYRYGILSAILAEVYDAADRTADVFRIRHRESYIREIIRELYDHFDAPPSVAELSRTYFVSTTKLCRDFKAYTSMSIHAYLTGIRITAACNMLRSGLPAGEIAEKCGFSSVNHFFTVFRQKTGLTTEEYRRSGMAQNPGDELFPPVEP